MGKSQLSLFAASTISKGGYWPVNNSSSKSGKVIIRSAEDASDDTIVPRLKALDAEMTRILIVDSVEVGELDRSMDLSFI